jgi:hypothetical protein
MKEPYEKPAIIYSGEVESRAVACAKVDNFSCAQGPITS